MNTGDVHWIAVDEVEDDEQLEVSVYLGTYDIAAGSCNNAAGELTLTHL